MDNSQDINTEHSKLLAEANELQSQLSAIYLTHRWDSARIREELYDIETQIKEQEAIEREKATKLRSEIADKLWNNPEELQNLLNL